MEKLELSFKPMLTPKEMLHKGIFGGTYFSRIVSHKDFPEDWFDGLDSSFYLSVARGQLSVAKSSSTDAKGNVLSPQCVVYKADGTSL